MMKLIEIEGPYCNYWEAHLNDEYVGDVFEDELDFFLATCKYPVEFAY